MAMSIDNWKIPIRAYVFGFIRITLQVSRQPMKMSEKTTLDDDETFLSSSLVAEEAK